MKRIIMLNTSPRGKKANSLTYLNALAGLFDLGEYQIDIYQMRSKEWDPIFAEMVQADYLVFATPLYLDSLSARTLDFLLRYERYLEEQQIKPSCPVYIIMNCGLLEAEQNKLAIEMLRYAFHKWGYTFRFAVAIGSGDAIAGPRFRAKITPALAYIKKDITQEFANTQNVYVQMPISKKFFCYVANRRWKKQGKKYYVKKNEMEGHAY